jgi:thioredoxin-related protein
MLRIILVLAWLAPLAGKCQQGIQWTEGLSWSQIMKKAKQENKHIFVDCFATWCQPCHLMDKNVYDNEEVGEAFNDKFISVKVQIDRTSYDNDTVKKWYADAKRIETNYTVKAFPTFLFFYPDGRPMHRAAGYRNPEQFIALSKEALDTQKQYYAILARYQPGKFDTSELKGLARALKNSGGELAARIATEYLFSISKEELGNEDNIKLMIEFKEYKGILPFVVKYLMGVPREDLSTEKNLQFIRNFSSVAEVKQLVLINYLEAINERNLSEQLPLLTIFKNEAEAKRIAQKFINELQSNAIFKKVMLFFIADFTKSSKDRGFEIFYNNSDKINKVVAIKDYAESIIDNIIIEEEYNAYYKAALANNVDNVPWNLIYEKVAKKFSKKIADRLNIWVRASLYGDFAKKKNIYWPEYIEFYIKKIENFGTDTSGPQHQFLDIMQLNNFVFDAIFYHSNDKKQIETGLKWMEGVVRRNPRHANNIDTYANLLYKAGRTKEAIQWQQKAVQIAAEGNEGWLLQALNGNLAKMQKGEPTWVKESKN